MPAIGLSDTADNTLPLQENADQTLNVTLQWRTFYKNGAWNTLCLPFDVENANLTECQEIYQDNPVVMELDVENSGLAGNVLTLKFKPLDFGPESEGRMVAGRPYLIKWDKGKNITHPTFTNVTINSTPPTGITLDDGSATLAGSYSPLASTDGLLFDAYNTDNRAFRASLNVSEPTLGRRAFLGWYTDAEMTTPVTTIPFAADGTVTLYAKWGELAGDANFDGDVDISDVTAIINSINHAESSTFDADAADVNSDNVIDISDVTGVINIINQ
jgi:uncharacterized repeat protein (TIGR02543 family)